MTASQKSNTFGKAYTTLATASFVVWAMYPIVWITGIGVHKLSVDTEIYIYAVLDILTNVVFALWVNQIHTSIPESRFKLGSFWTHGMGADYDAIDDEA